MLWGSPWSHWDFLTLLLLTAARGLLRNGEIIVSYIIACICMELFNGYSLKADPELRIFGHVTCWRHVLRGDHPRNRENRARKLKQPVISGSVPPLAWPLRGHVACTFYLSLLSTHSLTSQLLAWGHSSCCAFPVSLFYHLRSLCLEITTVCFLTACSSLLSCSLL